MPKSYLVKISIRPEEDIDELEKMILEGGKDLGFGRESLKRRLVSEDQVGDFYIFGVENKELAEMLRQYIIKKKYVVLEIWD